MAITYLSRPMASTTRLSASSPGCRVGFLAPQGPSNHSEIDFWSPDFTSPVFWLLDA